MARTWDEWLLKFAEDGNLTLVRTAVENGASELNEALYEAAYEARKGDDRSELVQYLLSQGADPTWKKNGKTALMACDDPTTKKALEGVTLMRDPSSALKSAVEDGDVEGARAAVEAGAEKEGVLKEAASRLDVKMVRFLLDSGAEPQTHDLSGALNRLPNHTGSLDKDLAEIMRMMEGVKPGTIAATNVAHVMEKSNQLDYFLSDKFDWTDDERSSILESRDAEGRTVLMASVDQGRNKRASELARLGANPLAPHKQGTECPLGVAALKGLTQATKTMERLATEGLRRGALTPPAGILLGLDEGLGKSIGLTPSDQDILEWKSPARGDFLACAAEDGRLDLVERALAAGADVNAEDPYFGNTPLSRACSKPGRGMEVFRRLVSAGGDLKHPSVLWAACKSGALEAINSALDHGADPNSKGVKTKGEEGCLGLLGAALREKIWSIPDENKQDETAQGYLAALRRLFHEGADMNSTNDRGQGVAESIVRIIGYSQNGDLSLRCSETLIEFVERGGDLMSGTEDSPVALVSRLGAFRSLDASIAERVRAPVLASARAGRIPEARDGGISVLHAAAEGNDHELARALIEGGMNPMTVDSKGRTAGGICARALDSIYDDKERLKAEEFVTLMAEAGGLSFGDCSEAARLGGVRMFESLIMVGADPSAMLRGKAKSAHWNLKMADEPVYDQGWSSFRSYGNMTKERHDQHVEDAARDVADIGRCLEAGGRPEGTLLQDLENQGSRGRELAGKIREMTAAEERRQLALVAAQPLSHATRRRI